MKTVELCIERGKKVMGFMLSGDRIFLGILTSACLLSKAEHKREMWSSFT